MSIATLKVLAEMLNDPSKPHYGLEIARATGLPSGSLYPILMRLEQHSWVTSQTEEIDPVKEGRKPRKYYTFTEVGLTNAQLEVDKMLRNLQSTPPQPIIQSLRMQILRKMASHPPQRA